MYWFQYHGKIRVYAMVDACIALPLPSVIQLKLVIIDINYITILQYYLVQEEI